MRGKPRGEEAVPILRCIVGGCLNADRSGDEIILYQSDRPDVKIVLTVEEYNAFVEQTKKIGGV